LILFLDIFTTSIQVAPAGTTSPFPAEDLRAALRVAFFLVVFLAGALRAAFFLVAAFLLEGEHFLAGERRVTAVFFVAALRVAFLAGALRAAFFLVAVFLADRTGERGATLVTAGDTLDFLLALRGDAILPRDAILFNSEKNILKELRKLYYDL